MKNMNLPEEWKELEKFCEPELKLVTKLLGKIEKTGRRILPGRRQVFEVFETLKPKDIKVVIFGNGPYISPNLVSNLALVSQGENNSEIYKIFSSFGSKKVVDFKLRNWIKQGVFLLNTALTCNYNEKRHKKNHYNIWLGFINKTIQYIEQINPNVVFVFMGLNKINQYSIMCSQRVFKIECCDVFSNRGYKEIEEYSPKIFDSINENLIKHNLKKIIW